MDTLSISKSAAQQAYKQGDKNTREMLEILFGKDVLDPKPKKITDRIKTFEDACAELGISVASVQAGYDTSDESAYKKLKVITKALNEGWEPDWNNSNEYKYNVWLTDHKPGFGFSRSRYVYWIANTDCGSRLCFKSRELAEYAGKQFLEIYNKFFIIKSNS